MASRRASGPKPRPQSLDATTSFHSSKFSQPGLNHLIGNDIDMNFLSLLNRGCSFGMPQFVNYASHRQSLPNLEYAIPFGNGLAAHELEPPLLPGGHSESPPDMSASMTPVEQDFTQFDELMPIPDDWDQAAYEHLLSMSGETDFTTSLDMAHVLDFMNPQQVAHISKDFAANAPKTAPLQFAPMETAQSSPRREVPPARLQDSMDVDAADDVQAPPLGSDESDALLACQESWPFFCCNRVPKSGCFPPRTAARYVEGLMQVLTTHTWDMPRINQHAGAKSAARTLLQEDDQMVSIVGHSTETLNAVTHALLRKACTTHRADQDTINGSPNFALEDESGVAVHLPPSDTITHFLESYITHHKPYYPCAVDLAASKLPVLQSNIEASGLLMLLTIAQGAAFVPTPAARYLASGLIEACRLFLFESIEKDILLSREPVVLQSALLFTTAAAWSGDNWHMDIAMGQRGMYLSMMSHARMFDGHEGGPSSDDIRHDQARAWQEWKVSEERRRIAYSWIIVDQELSLFSDTTPLLNVVNIQAPMPSSEHLWAARTADEWAVRYQEVLKDKSLEGASLRDLFTSFVEGELSNTDIDLSPIQLRLLLHPLQTLVCQLRQFLTCLPDSGRQSMGTSISKVAIKARLEEISALLRQWYAFTQRCIAKEGGETCWTTKASLIMYHLISLNTRSSLAFIEQFARGEVQCASARHASQWLKRHCVDEPEEILFHCGQVMRLITSTPDALRPPWWAGAIYRVGLIGWATSMAGAAGSRLPLDHATEVDKPFAIDTLEPEHPSIQQYLQYKEGVPMLSRRNGRLVEMKVPINILQHCVSILEEDLSMRASEGIMRKLQGLLDRWINPPFETVA